MKELVIIYNQPLNSKQGINTVNQSFIDGQKYFHEKGIKLTKIVGSNGMIDCSENVSLDSGVTSVTASKRRVVMNAVRRIFGHNVLIDCFRIYRSCYSTAKKAIGYFMLSGCDPDFIIFQDPQTAEMYYNKFNGRKAKTIMILHCSKSATEQAVTTWPSYFNHKLLSKPFFKTYEVAMQQVDKVVYLSQRAVDYSPVPKEKKIYIFNGEEDVSNHNYVDIGSIINLVSVASMSWHKGQELVLEAMAKLAKDVLSKVKYHLIGAGPQMQELREIVIKFNLTNNVIFYGTRNDVPELLKEMDVFILPSKSEGLPMSIIEALRQGMYLMATDTGAIPEMIAPGCGEIIERDADQIAQSLSRLVLDNVLTLDVKKKAREHYTTYFTLKKMIHNYCDVLLSL